MDNESSGGKWIKMQPQTGRFPNGHFVQEQNDVSAQQPEIVQKIEAIFTQEHTPAEIDRFKIKQLGD